MMGIRKYIKTILEKSDSKLIKIFDDKKILDKFIESVNKIEAQNKEDEIEQFIKLYNTAIKTAYQNKEPYDKKTYKFLNTNPEQNQDCLGRFPRPVEKTAF